VCRCALALVTGAALLLNAGIARSTVVSPPPGPQPDGTGITAQGWHLTPAGTQTSVGNGPLAVAISPDGSMVLVATGGYRNQSIEVVDPSTDSVTQTISTVRAGWGHTHGYSVGVAFSPDGSTAYASDGPKDGIHVFVVADGSLTEEPEVSLPSRSWPAGFAISSDGARAYVAANLAGAILGVDLSSGATLFTAPVGHRPYGVALNHSGSRAFVSNWGGNTVSMVRTSTGRTIDKIRTGRHPSALALNPVSDELYVANTDADTVSVIDTEASTVLRTIDLRPYPDARMGASPNALTVSPDGATLYVANAGNNDIAVVELAAPGTTTEGDVVAGLIPTGWYPDGVVLDPSGSTLFVTNMYGLGTGPVQPGRYIAGLMRGSLSRIAVPNPGELAQYTLQVAENDRFEEPLPIVTDSPIPSQLGDASPIEHVIYVLKENRTYDQVLGDMRRGNGDPSYAMFPAEVTPNQHRLARRFVTLDNFFTDGAVSADGWAWSTEAYANTYVNKNWPSDYGVYGRPYDFGGFGDEETAGVVGKPDDSFLWDRLAQAGISYRNYGFFMNARPRDLDSMPNLTGHTNPDYPGWALWIPDQVRIDVWLDEFRHYERCGCLPSVEFVYLPRDHTVGSATTMPKPTAMVADNDYALGRLVEAVSHSAYWPSTAIFVVEDDAQDGPDHVSGYRTVALAISPYSQTGTVDPTFYSTVSMLRTMELILGVPPLTQFDARATPMYGAFTSTPNLRPYTAAVPRRSLTALNQVGAPMGRISSRLDWSSPDASDEDVLNLAIWRSVMGRLTPMPTG
jgi:YVTN family beta-propeller protein